MKRRRVIVESLVDAHGARILSGLSPAEFAAMVEDGKFPAALPNLPGSAPNWDVAVVKRWAAFAKKESSK